ncbi:hypothetical protein [Ancylobacter pratisalsi]|uniref:Oligosaccharide flippase family protein n=1 Tax=Ancylobacter pratisalsi TaxID=1745854 RepID=A0A6P1YNI4_9HYPH|nr:hypothetical protein [Ancylobacter pratisalsi]QIB34266.1 hypothetical protein G3A50_11510 [Ancylobacter pratisalsi]
MSLERGSLQHRVKRFADLLQLRLSHIAGYLAGGMAARGIDLVTALLIIHHLTPEKYAVYATVVGTSPIYSIIFVSGILPIYMSIIGQHSDETAKIIALRQHARRLILRENWWTYLVAAIVCSILLGRLTPSILDIFIGVIIIMMSCAIGSLMRIEEVSLRITGRQLVIVYGSFLQSFIRVAGLGFLLLGDEAIYFLLATTVVGLLGNLLLISRSLDRSFGSVPADASLVAEMTDRSRGMRRNSLPVDSFQAATGQFYYWVLAFFVGPVGVAGFAAIARLGQTLYPVTVLLQGFLIPGFARLRSQHDLQKYFFALVVAVGLVLLPIVVVCYLFPSYVLLLIGPDYSNLGLALKLYAAGLVLHQMSEFADGLLRSRGQIMKAWITIPIDAVAFLAPILIFGGSSVAQVALAFVFISTTRLIKFALMGLVIFRKRRV